MKNGSDLFYFHFFCKNKIMNILKKTEPPVFEIITRIPFDTSENLALVITSENSKKIQTITANAVLLPNENYLLTLESFPEGKTDEKFSYSLLVENTKVLLSLGRLMILAQNEDVQNYSKKENTKFYT